jgi:hypothetical protein
MEEGRRQIILEELKTASDAIRSVECALSWEGVNPWQVSFRLWQGILQMEYPEVYKVLIDRLNEASPLRPTSELDENP